MALNSDNEVCRKCGRVTQVLFNMLRYCVVCEGDDRREDTLKIDLDREELSDIKINIEDYLY